MKLSAPPPTGPDTNPLAPAPVSKLSSPLDLRERATPPRFVIDGVPFLDILAIALLMLLVSNHFFFSPGLSLDLPTSLPGKTEVARVDSVMSLSGERLVLRSGIYHIDNILEGLQEERLRIGHDQPVLLVKAPRDTSLDALNHIVALARRAGFETVHLAAHPADTASPQ